MKPTVKTVLDAAEALKIGHYSCEDDYYNCSAIRDGYREDENSKHTCNCGISNQHAEVDVLKTLILQLVQEFE